MVVFTYSGSLKLTHISYRLGFSFVSFSCIVRSFIVFRLPAFRSCNWFVCFVYRSFRVSFVSFVSLIRGTPEAKYERTFSVCLRFVRVIGSFYSPVSFVSCIVRCVRQFN